jgi:hypothetical protein
MAASQELKNAIYGSLTSTTAGNEMITCLNRVAATGSAYVQTYATATLTHSNPTATVLTDSSGGAANTTVQAIGGSFSQSEIANNFADVTAAINALIVDVANVKQVLNSVIDNMQAAGAAT